MYTGGQRVNDADSNSFHEKESTGMATFANNIHTKSSSLSTHTSAQAEANDLGALIFEYGTSRCKLGYAGEDFPHVYESILSRRVGKDHFQVAKEAKEMESDTEGICDWLMKMGTTNLQVDWIERPLLLVERPFNTLDRSANKSISTGRGVDMKETDSRMRRPTGKVRNSGSVPIRNHLDSDHTKENIKQTRKVREDMVQVLMEQLGLPALFCSKSSVLACYANARTSGLVVEMGATYTSISTIQEGYAFRYPRTQMIEFGGFDLDAFLQSRLHSQWEAQNLCTELKHPLWTYYTQAKESSLCHVADTTFLEDENTQLPRIQYELPDKTIISLGTERFSVAEHYFKCDTDDKRPTPTPSNGMSLSDLVCEVGAFTTETDARRDLFQNIIVTGGSSCFENLTTRLEKEAVASLQKRSFSATGNTQPSTNTNSGFIGAGNNLRVKVIAAQPQERKIGSFLGGSIVGSLGSFHEMWMSKAEYAEHGPSLIHKKCP
uniref:Actinlike protein putative n=1 Tax=Albugo laibachii Nc14 TaxID=890382 RepID=F0W5P6_9STRA|nr:actinlike protein putative [Albugo laibachii Nc14]|eukprot:CCA16437.1 actinlike protein putative [Albugo laibachii Nc14]